MKYLLEMIMSLIDYPENCSSLIVSFWKPNLILPDKPPNKIGIQCTNSSFKGIAFQVKFFMGCKTRK